MIGRKQSACSRAIFLCAVAAIIATPLLGHALFAPSIQSDNRALASLPSVPRSLPAIIEWPRRVDAYLRDNFGFRAQLVSAYVTLNWSVLGTSSEPSVVVGRNGRLFLSEGDVPNRVLLRNCGAWWAEDYRDQWTVEADSALRRLSADFPRLSVLVVPTSSVLYSAELPSWIERACAGKTPLVEDLMARLPADTRRLIAYPISAAKRLPPGAPLIPKHNFHWNGQGVDLFMGAYVDNRFGLKRQIAPNWEVASVPSDLARFLPGVGLSNSIVAAVWNPETVAICSEDHCLHRAPLDGLTLPRETLRVARRGDGEPLLLLSDSFGAAAASSLIEYFRDVVMINMNNFQSLDEEDRRALWRRLRDNWRDAHVLALVQDGNVSLLSRFAKSLVE